MNPIVHAELSWLMAQRLEERRDRLLVVRAGLAPDLDGLSILGGGELYGGTGTASGNWPPGRTASSGWCWRRPRLPTWLPGRFITAMRQTL